MACSTWAATRTHEDDFRSFLASRVMAGGFASLSCIIGSTFIVDMFFLHQRGRAFAIYGIMPALGTLMGSTFGAFIAGKQKWTVSFWWTTPLLGLVAILIFLTTEETRRRSVQAGDRKVPRHGYLASRMATFFPGTKVTIRSTSFEIVSRC